MFQQKRMTPFSARNPLLVEVLVEGGDFDPAQAICPGMPQNQTIKKRVFTQTAVIDVAKRYSGRGWHPSRQ